MLKSLLARHPLPRLQTKAIDDKVDQETLVLGNLAQDLVITQLQAERSCCLSLSTRAIAPLPAKNLFDQRGLDLRLHTGKARIRVWDWRRNSTWSVQVKEWCVVIVSEHRFTVEPATEEAVILDELVLALRQEQGQSVVQLCCDAAQAPHISREVVPSALAQDHFGCPVVARADVGETSLPPAARRAQIHDFHFFLRRCGKDNIFWFEVAVHDATLFQVTQPFCHLPHHQLQQAHIRETSHIGLFELSIEVVALEQFENEA